MNSKTKKMTLLAMFCAIAYAVMVFGRIPVVSFLKYDPKDIVITLSGLIYGPASACLVSVIVSVIEMVTVSETGIIGLVMNVLSTVSFAAVSAYIYKKNRTLKGAVYGLICGAFAMTAIMILWNYLITPLYMGLPREEIAKMLLPVFLPFNLIKATLNAAITLVVYKPLVRGLRKANIITGKENNTQKTSIGLIITSAVIIISCILIILVLNGII